MSLLPPHVTGANIRYPFLVALLIVHVLAFAAPFTFSWLGLAVFLAMYFITGCLGVTLCYHRLLSHRSFKTPRWMRNLLMLCGTLSFEGDPAWWVATHRLHHRESDQDMDPHSPKVSFAWGHVLWLLYDDPRLSDPAVLSRFIPELVNDRWARFLERAFLPINLGFIALLFAVGYALEGLSLAISLAVWGGFFRIAVVWHVTWLVNSATHMWGYRGYETRDDSRNNWLVALLTFGEGWHNNHHALPSAARSGHRWWEFDLTYGVIQLMQVLGLAWKLHPVTRPAPALVRPLTSADSRKVQPR